jgi:nucleoside-diphosphate-sugar epimerase
MWGGVDSLSIRSCYPLGKKVAELLCKSYYEEYGVDVKILRPTVIFGLWQPYDSVKVEAEILRCVMENKNLYMKSAGLTKKCVIYSLDAISATFKVLFDGCAGEAYNATNPDSFCTVKDRAYHSFEVFNPNITIEFAETDVSTSQGYLPQRSLLEDVSKIKRLGWKPLTGMDDIYKVDIERFKSKGK